MAGAGYKLFTTGSVLTAAEVNTYLQEQAVMRFATVAARTAALSGVLAEGMVSYIDATDTLEVYNGSAWISAIGDITEVQGSTGISVASGTGPVPVITNSMATAIDAKGDLIVGTADNAFSRLAVSDNGSTLVADSSASTGLRWQAAVASGRNKLLNSDFTIWQRGQSFTGNDIYTADRWKHYYGAGTWTMSRTTSNLPTGFQYGFNMVNSGTAASVFIAQTIETANAITLAGQTVTVSGYVRASTNGNFVINVGTSANTDEGSSGTFTTASATGNTWAATTTPTRFSAQFVIPSNTKTIRVEINSPNLGSGASATMTGFQIEVGSVATPFVTATGTLAGEYLACLRYYEKSTAVVSSQFDTSAKRYLSYSFAAPKRNTPSMSISDGAGNANRVTTKAGYLGANTDNVTGYFQADTTPFRFSIGDNTNAANFGMNFNYEANSEL